MNQEFEGAVEKTQGVYFNVLSDGTFRLRCDESHPKAVRREIKDNKTGAITGVKFERVFKQLSGVISNIQFHNGEYGTNIIITIDDANGTKANISVGTASPFGEDLMKKLPNVNLDKQVTFAPYAFEDENGKMKKGITITQGDTKVPSFFSIKNDETGKWDTANGYPTPKGDTTKYNSDKWKIYFTECRVFLMEYMEKYILPKYEGVVAQKTPASDVDPVDVPF